ncbi:hypothetical protein F5B20DRAFT_550495 [Whalleya microplaca]|nr:hypothetical protein F5B20DRAFT_550495 [Whalleya microplaca]
MAKTKKLFGAKLFDDAIAKFKHSAPPAETQPTISDVLIQEFDTTQDINATIEKWKIEFINRRHPPDGSPLRKACEKVGAHIGEIVNAVGIVQSTFNIVANAVPVTAPVATTLAAFSGVFDSFRKVSEEFDKIVEFFDTFSKMFRNMEQLKGTEDKSVDLDFVLESVDELLAASIDACVLAIRAPEHRIKMWIELALGDDEVGPALQKVRKATLAVQERISTVGLKVSFDIRYILVDVKDTADKTYGQVLLGNQKQDEILERQKDSDRKNERLLAEVIKKIDERRPAAQKNTNRDIVSRRNAIFLELKQNLEPVIDQSGYIQDLKGWQVPGSSGWLFDKRYSRWCTTEKQLLWVHGAAGIGKSYMSLAAIQELEKEKKLFANFFFRENRDSSRSLKGALSSMVLQVARNDSQYSGEILNILKTLPETQELQELFTNFFINRKTDRELFLVFDGIDEAQEEEQAALINILDLAIKKTPKIRILITSRCAPIIESVETQTATTIEAMKIDELQSSFKVVCRERIESHHRLRKFSKRSKKVIIAQLTQKADGMIYIKNMLNFFETLGLEKDVLKQVYTNMPQSLDGVYDMILEECYKERTEKQSEILKEVFAWIAFGTRRLTLQEVAYLAKRSSSANERLIIQEEIRQKLSGILELVRSIEHEELTDEDEEFSMSRDVHEKDGINAIISYVDDKLFALQFQERSLRDYFRKKEQSQSNNRWSPFKARLSVLKTCVSLLCDESIEHDQESDQQNGEQDDRQVSYRLKMHAANRWDEHFAELSKDIGQAQDEDVLQMTELLSKLMTNSGNATKALEDFAQWRYREYEFSDGKSLTDVTSEWVTRASSISLENQKLKLSQEAQEWLSQVSSEGGVSKMMGSLAKAHGKNWLRETNSALAKEAFLFARDALLLSDGVTEEDGDSSHDPNDDDCPVEYFEGIIKKIMDNEGDKAFGNERTNRALGLVFYWYERFPLAIEYFEKSVHESSSQLERYHGLVARAKAWGHIGEVEKARQFFTDALEALNSLPQSQAEIPKNQILKRTALLRYADFETENEEIIRLLNDARHCVGIGILDGDSLDDLTVALEKSKDEKHQLMRAIQEWSIEERSSWLKWAMEDEANINNAITRLEKAATEIDKKSDLEKILTAVVRPSRTTPVWARYRLSRMYSQVLHSIDKAEGLLKVLMKERPTAETKEILRSARQDYVKIIYHKFRSANTRTEKDAYIKILGTIEKLDSDDLRASYLSIIQARMMRAVGNLGAYKEKLSDAFKVCLKGLTDDDLENDIYAFRRLAVVLSSLEVLKRDARIAYSLQYSKVNLSKPETTTGEGSDTNAPESSSIQVIEEREDQPNHNYTGEQECLHVKTEDLKGEDSTYNNTNFIVGGTVLVQQPDNLFAEISCSVETYSYGDNYAEDLNEFSWSSCDVCDEVPTCFWSKPAYLCLVCVIGTVCSDCFDKREQAKHEEIPGKWYGYCGRRHKYLKGPIDGWQGVKDGMIRIQGEEPIKFQEWLTGLKEKWENAWNDDDESFIWDII